MEIQREEETRRLREENKRMRGWMKTLQDSIKLQQTVCLELMNYTGADSMDLDGLESEDEPITTSSNLLDSSALPPNGMFLQLD